MKAADIMTANVITVDCEMQVAEVAKILLANHISGAPVVDQKRHIVGTITEADLMRRAESDASSLAKIAKILESCGINRASVVENGSLVGIVSRADVLRGLASEHAEAKGGSDPEIRQQIMNMVHRNTSVPLHAVSIIVNGGFVYLWGTVNNTAQCDAVRAAAENVVGAGKAYDNLDVHSDAM